MANSLPLLGKFFHLLIFCVLFFYSFSYQTCVYGARELASLHHATQKKSLMTASPCSASTEASCTPLGQENQSPTSGEILLQDQSKVRSLSSISSIGFFPGTILPLLKRLDSGAFAVQVSFGTPKRDFTLMFDTASSWTWIKCPPCPNCGDEPIFDPSTSSTSSTASCASPPCNFIADYHDSSYSKGSYYRDTLTLSSFGIPDFVFGCGRDISTDFSEVAGVLGTERGDDGNSLLSQTLRVFQQTFCYCLPSTESSSTGYLSFGAQAVLTCLPVPAEITIPLTTDSDHYYVKLVGITIGQKRVEMSSNADQESSPRTIIDTGTIISRLPGSVYAELQSTFKELMAQYLPAQPSDLLDTCYNLQGLDINNIVPSIILHFQGFNGYEDLNLDPSSTVWKEKGGGDSQVCLAFAGNKDSTDLTIIGNQQQLNINIRYDINNKQVGFRMNGCSN